MSVVSVRARSFILALFIRDDGERFLLGDRGFDFKDSQLHFSANTIENDEVEKQGVDGVMLAGQVRRASVQSFDGYVGDGTTLKEEVEQMRRDFIAFFAKGHYFRVIYIDCNRNAWQRKGGYLVDAPEVKELWQIHPEYHVGLNFEDVNYYEYDENAEGEEILSNIISVPISSDVEGGLVWDENGAVSEPAEIGYDTETATASGESISIADAVEAPLSDFKLKGETSQNGTPTPDAPVAVQTVTGENVVKISDGQNEQSYEVNLGDDTLLLPDGTFTNAGVSAVFGKNTIIVNRTSSNSSTSFIRVDLENPITVHAGDTFTLYAENYQTIGSTNAGGAYMAIRMSTASADDSTTDVFLGSANARTTKTASADKTYTRFVIRTASSLSPSNFLIKPKLIINGQDKSIELCKIGTYQDYIYKSGDKWYVHKEIGDYVATGDEDISIISRPTNKMIYIPNDEALQGSSNTLLSTHFIYSWANNIGACYISATNHVIVCGVGGVTTVESARTWLASNEPKFVYMLATPTDTEITNAALIAQLEAILSQGKTYAGTNNITTVIAAGNAQGELEITYYTKYDAKVVGGYVWEAGGSGGPTIVTNESISAVSPVWTVFGPALNPMLENTTTGEQIQYVGMISEGQTLVVDMGEQTASLDGLNVISNIVGEYLTLAPGSNTLLFSADSDAPASEIGWSEIVG